MCTITFEAGEIFRMHGVNITIEPEISGHTVHERMTCRRPPKMKFSNNREQDNIQSNGQTTLSSNNSDSTEYKSGKSSDLCDLGT